MEEIENYIQDIFEEFPDLCSNTEYRFLPRSYGLFIEDKGKEFFLTKRVFENISSKAKKLLLKLNTSNELNNLDKSVIVAHLNLLILEFDTRKIHEVNPSFYLNTCKWAILNFLDSKETSEFPFLVRKLEGVLDSLLKNIHSIEIDTRQYHLSVLGELLETISLVDSIDMMVVGRLKGKFDKLKEFLSNLEEKNNYNVKDFFTNILYAGLYVKDDLESFFQRVKTFYSNCLRESCSGEILVDNNSEEENLKKAAEFITDTLKHNNFPYFSEETIEIVDVPAYLKSAWPKAVWYNGKMYLNRDGDKVNKELAKVLLAHEYFPGHGLQESLMKQLGDFKKNIENPTHYEGWAVYSEYLVAQNGDDQLKSVNNRYFSFRAMRIMIDFYVNFFGTDVGELIENYPHKEMKKLLEGVVVDVKVNRGEYVSYLYGYFKLLELEEKYLKKVGPRNFYEVILTNGQPDFDELEKKYLNMLN
jgi:hypothetical protein